MTPDELAAIHPRLYHATSPRAWPSIREHGLLCAEALTHLFEIDRARRQTLLRKPRRTTEPITHPRHGRAELSDNLPLSVTALATCLDDGLRPEQWLAMLNARVFFWATRDGLERLLGARSNRERPRLVLELDTLSLARAHADRLGLSPINSGSTIRKPARRGLATYMPLGRHAYADWRRLRGRCDRVLEVTVEEAVPDVERHLTDLWRSDGAPFARSTARSLACPSGRS